MAAQSILSAKQQELLHLFVHEPAIARYFYLSGGTALAEFYLHHRYSEDLDFFSETEIAPQSVFATLKKLGKKAGVKKIDFQASFNRNLFFLQLPKETIKTEFTYYPFPRIEQKKIIGQLAVDSLLDIAVNKIFTIYQNPRARDFIDLYCILEEQKWTIAELIKKAKIKFDWHVDSLQLGSQFLQATVLKDYPRMIKKIKPSVWQNFFVAEAHKLKADIFEK